MRQVMVIVLAGLLVGCGAKKTRWDEDDLLGKVKTVETELALMKDNHHLIEGARSPLSMTSYTKAGDRIQSALYLVTDSPIGESFETVNRQGNKIHVASYHANGSLDSKHLTLYDAEGKRVEELLFGDDGAVCERTVYTYGSDGKELVTGSGSCNDDTGIKWRKATDGHGNTREKVLRDEMEEAALLRVMYSYDKSGKLTDVASYGTEDALVGKWAYEYDEHGRRTTATLYAGDGTRLATWRYSYEFDQRGNWIKRLTERAINGSGTIEPIAVVYRNIAYYR